MQYLIIAYDYDDAYERRVKVRDEHVKMAKEFMEKGNIITAGQHFLLSLKMMMSWKLGLKMILMLLEMFGIMKIFR